MKKILGWPKEIYIFWIMEFILGVELIGPLLLVFFQGWGGLNQTQTQSLQSWFTLCIFLLEIPTGVYGDVKGKKKSVLIGYAFTALGTFVYTLVPNIWIFALSEFIFALGIAFISGSEEAWMYDISKKYHLEDSFREIIVTARTLNMIGMILAAGISIWVSGILPVQQIFRLGVIPNLIAIILLGLFVQGTNGFKKESLKPNYKDTMVEAFKILNNSLNLRKLVIYTGLLASTSYFVIWLYQKALIVLSVPEEMLGVYRIALLVAEIVVMRIMIILLRRVNLQKMFVIMAIVVGLGFILGGVLHSIAGVFFVLVFAGGLGLQVSSLTSKEINMEIPCEQRATVLSFIGMARRLMLTVFNPVVGLLVDTKGVFIAFTVLGVISLLAIFFKPKIMSK
ncbi:MFS transporter [Patescibacteria group bacterium]|nr:MFS transporter [Patescibacteria group bacterium]